MNVALSGAGEATVQQGLVNVAGAVVGVGGLLLVAAWWAYFYR
ncbi:MAG: hypothetical protein ABEJ30_05120 [Halorientalis sp.]